MADSVARALAVALGGGGGGRGPMGPTGPVGPQGPTGVAGPQGPAGADGSQVSVSATGTSTDTVAYITIDETEYKLAGGGSGTSDYEDLTNKPQINDTELVGNLDLEDIGVNVLEAGEALEIDDSGNINVKVDGETIIINADNELTAVGGGKQLIGGEGIRIDEDDNLWVSVNFDHDTIINPDNILQTSIGGYVKDEIEWTDLPYDTTNESYKDYIEHSKAEHTISKYNTGETYGKYGIIKDNNDTYIYEGYIGFEVTDKVDGEYLEGTWWFTDHTEYSGTIKVDAVNDTIELYNLSDGFPTGEGYIVSLELLYSLSIGNIDGRVIPIDNTTITLNGDGQLQASGGGSSYTFTNGLTENDGTVSLGGAHLEYSENAYDGVISINGTSRSVGYSDLNTYSLVLYHGSGNGRGKILLAPNGNNAFLTYEATGSTFGSMLKTTKFKTNENVSAGTTVSLTFPAQTGEIPAAVLPSSDGNYVLKCSVTDGVATYRWEAE